MRGRKAWGLFCPVVLIVVACAGQDDLQSGGYVGSTGDSLPTVSTGRGVKGTGDADVLQPAKENSVMTPAVADAATPIPVVTPPPPRALTLAPGGWALPVPSEDHRLIYVPNASPETTPLLLLYANARTQSITLPATTPAPIAAPQAFPLWTGATGWLSHPLAVWTLDADGVRRYVWQTATALPSKTLDLAYAEGTGAARALGVTPGAFLARRGANLIVATEGASPTLTSYPLPERIATLPDDSALAVQHLWGGDFVLVAPTVTATFLASPNGGVWRVSRWTLPSDAAAACSGIAAFLRAVETAAAYEGRFVLRCGPSYRLSDAVSLSRETGMVTPTPVTSPTPDPKGAAWTTLSPLLNAHCVGCHAHSFQNGDRAVLPTRAWVQENAAAMKNRILRSPNTALVMPMSPKATWTEAVKNNAATALSELSQ